MRTESPLWSNELENKTIFLSSSFPQSERDERYFKTANPLEITDAVIAVARAVFSRKGKLVFGGHPTISPLILSVGEEFISFFEEAYLPIVYIYQSKYFKTVISEYTKKLIEKRIGDKIRWTPAVDNDREKSLALMRGKMLDDTDPIAGIFIGGMEGVEDEFKLFTSFFENRPVYCIGSVGGASKILAERILKNKILFGFEYKEVTREMLLEFNVYPTLLKAVISDLRGKLCRFGKEQGGLL